MFWCATGVNLHPHACVSLARCGQSSTSCPPKRTVPACLACHLSCHAPFTPVRKICMMPSGSRFLDWRAHCLHRRPATMHRTGELSSTSLVWVVFFRKQWPTLHFQLNLCSYLLERFFSVRHKMPQTQKNFLYHNTNYSKLSQYF